MEYVGIESIKKAYRDALQAKGKYEVASSLNQKEFTDPVYEGLTIHAEIEPDLTVLNDALQRIAIDIIALNSQYSSVANMYNDMMLEILTDLESVDEIIGMEEERIQDLNIITGNITSFTSVRTFTADDLSGTCSIEDEHTFMCHSTDRTSVVLEIEDVSGNGYEGNVYVYSNDDYEKNSVDSSIRTKMNDAYSASYWEYSRITMPKITQNYPPDINFDNIEAECTITLYSTDAFNSIRLQSDITNVSVEQISVSEDGGVTFYDTMNYPVQVLEDAQKYEDSTYIYGSGLLSFPGANYVKIRLKSHGVLNEKLAFNKVILDNVKWFQDVSFDTEDYITEYLKPVLTLTRPVELSKIPLSVIIGICLIRTGVKPVNIGMFNFWYLPYKASLTNEKEDKAKCAFKNRESAGACIFEFIKSKPDLMTIIETLPNIPADCTLEQCLAFGEAILNLLSDDPAVTLKTLENYYIQYNLQQYDAEVLINTEEKVYQKYEQYFMRFDEQSMSYDEALKKAEVTIPLDNAQRHVIRVNDITAFKSTYEQESYLETKELISTPVDCIAIFANEYYPPTFPTDASVYGTEDYLTYILTVNGTEYTVVPVNSQKSGVKIIRYSNYTITENYTVHIAEPIKSATIKVKFRTPNPSYTPYLSNLKVCLGKAVVNL